MFGFGYFRDHSRNSMFGFGYSDFGLQGLLMGKYVNLSLHYYWASQEKSKRSDTQLHASLTADYDEFAWQTPVRSQ